MRSTISRSGRFSVASCSPSMPSRGDVEHVTLRAEPFDDVGGRLGVVFDQEDVHDAFLGAPTLDYRSPM